MNLFWIAGLGLLFSTSAYFLRPRLDSDDIQHAATVARDSLSNPLVIIGISWLSSVLAISLGIGLGLEIPCCVQRRWNSMVESSSSIMNCVTGLPLRIANSLQYNTRRRIRTYVGGSIIHFIALSYLCNMVLWFFNGNWVLWDLLQFCYILGACSEEVFTWVTTECRDESMLYARTFFSGIHLPSVIILFLRRDIWNSLALFFIFPSFISLVIQYMLLNSQFDPQRRIRNEDAPRIYENLEEHSFVLNNMPFFLRQFHVRNPQLPAHVASPQQTRVASPQQARVAALQEAHVAPPQQAHEEDAVVALEKVDVEEFAVVALEKVDGEEVAVETLEKVDVEEVAVETLENVNVKEVVVEAFEEIAVEEVAMEALEEIAVEAHEEVRKGGHGIE